MKIEIPDDLSDEMLVITQTKLPSPVAYINVYEKGDVWVKIKGCDDCPWEKRQLCCGTCPLNTEKGCLYHLEVIKNGGTCNKPFNCVIRPTPKDTFSWCQIEFKCVRGSMKNDIKKVAKGKSY